MESEAYERRWAALSEEVLTGMRDWRVQHPQATLREIEDELDGRLARLRARMLEDLALQSRAATWPAGPPAQRPTCPQCGAALAPRGTHPRRLKTHGGQELTLPRTYGVCPQCGQGHFPPG
jgi:YgiT-type zinc finger domain-containing protein